MWEAAVSPRHPLDDGARRVFRPARAVFYLAGGTRLSSFRCSLRHILVRIGVFRHLDPVPFIFSGLLLLPLRGLRLRYAIWAFHDFAGSPRCVLLRRGWTLAFWSPGVGSRTLPSRLCGICGSFGLRFALSCFVNSRPGGRSRGFGPRVWWAWACGWDAGGPPSALCGGRGTLGRGFLSAFVLCAATFGCLLGLGRPVSLRGPVLFADFGSVCRRVAPPGTRDPSSPW